MAEEASTAPPVEAPAPEAAEPTQTNGDTSAVPKEDEETVDMQDTTEMAAAEGDKTDVAEATEPTTVATDEAEAATPASGSKKERRKSSGGIPEHKAKKLNKKKSMPSLHLECQPGEFYWAKLKGYPEWPAVVCDEQMLPESLLATRPVSTARPDGSIRDDFKEGGKNAKERTFPVMFLSTNEFMWMVNTCLEPLDLEMVKELPKKKMTKALQNAWKIAAENHDLDYFKGILKTWQEEEAQIEKEMREEEERQRKLAEEKAIRDEEEAQKLAEEEAQDKKKKKSRKSKGGDGDVEMDDADAPKSAKKRKKEGESDGDKPKKTPKVTKLNAPKTPNGDSSKKSATKSKKKVVQPPKEEEEEEKPKMSELEKQQQREKAVLYLRHRLQKGFLSRDQAPQETEMAAMAEFFAQLESYENLEASIIRATKVHKVLKAIVKLSSIPKDEEYNFKKRSAAMLEIWNKRMEGDGDAGVPASATETKPSASFTTPAAEEDEKKTEPAEEAETNGEKVADATEEAEPAKDDDEDETMEGAQMEEKAEEAAEKLDEKVEAVIAEPVDEKEEPAAEPTVEAEATRDAGDVLKDITMGEAEPTEEMAKEPQATVSEIPAAPEVD